MSSLVLRFGAPLLLASSALMACGEGTPEDLEAIDQIEQGLETFPNQRPAYDFFVAKGLTPAQSAGIVGNLSAESGVDPTIRQLGGGPGRGIAQWQAGGRWDTTAAGNVVDFAADLGLSATSLQAQLQFIWFELETFPTFGLARLRTQTTASAAALAFMQDYEGCARCATQKRIDYANDVLARFGSGGGTSSSSSSSGSSAPACVVTTTGESGECLAVSECADLGGVSTPGFCPGSSSVQCCTGIETEEPENPSTSSSSGGSSGASSRPDAGPDDVDPDDDGVPGRIGVAPEEQGCSTSGRGGVQGLGGWLLGLGFVLAARRFRAREPKR